MPVTINGSNTPTAGGVTYGDGTQYATTSAGTSGQALLSAGSSAPTWGTPASATTATNLAGGSAGTVPYQSASGTTAMLAAGSSGQVLTSSGAGAPTWSTPSAGAMVFISSQTVSSAVAQVDFTSGFSSTYDDYVLMYENLTCSTGGTELAVRFYKSGSFQTASYKQQYTEARGTGTTVSNTASTAFIPLNTGNESDVDKRCGVVNLFNINSTAAYGAQLQASVSTSNSTTNTSVTQSCGSQATAAAVTGIRFLFGSGGNFASGTFRLYGIAKA